MRLSIRKALEEIRDKRKERIKRFDTEEDGWFTGKKSGEVFHVNESGEIDKGNPNMLAAAEKKGAKLSKKAEAKAKNSEVGSGRAKTKGGTEFPKTKDGTDYRKDIQRVEEEFEKDIEDHLMEDPGRFDKVVSELREKDVVYQKDPSGKEFACVPLLACKIDNDAGNPEIQKTFEKAVEDGKAITEDMLDVSKEVGCYLTGLENAVKGASHIADKALRKQKEAEEAIKNGKQNKYIDPTTGKPKNQEEIAASFGDLVRYTAMTTNDKYVDTVKNTLKALEKKGFEITEVENKYVGDDGKADLNSDYRAVHITAVTPEGRQVEIQVHSEESMAVKDKNHPLYNVWRNLPGDSPERERLGKIMKQNWDDYTNPVGIEEIKTFRK